MSKNKQFQCVQFGTCPRAASGECFEVNADFRCTRSPELPDCRERLVEITQRNRGLSFKIGVPVVLGAAIATGLYFWLAKEPPTDGGAAKPKRSVEELLRDVWPDLK